MRKNKKVSENNQIKILNLDDDNLMTLTVQSYFQASGYVVETENDPERAIERVRAGSYDILLLDFLMTPICGDVVVARIREFNPDIFIILLTGHKSMAPPIKTIRSLDIQGYYEKSDRFDQLELLVESCVKSINQLRTIREYRDSLSHTAAELERANKLLRSNYSDIVNAMRSIVEARDIYTRGHSDRVACLSALISNAMGRGAEAAERIRVAGLFHDIGKIRIPDRILLKDGRLTDEEYAEVKKHPKYAYDIISNAAMFADVLPAVLHHHERFDGLGYPEGLAGRDIPEDARIICVADSFDAMTSFRRYRKNLSFEEAVSQLSEYSGKQFDPDIIDVSHSVFKDFSSIQRSPDWSYPQIT